MMKYLQKLGKALMLPVAVLPICGILMHGCSPSVPLSAWLTTMVPQVWPVWSAT